MVAGPAYDQVIEALRSGGRRVVVNGLRASAQCPAHADHDPSLSVTAIEGRILVHCHGGCDVVDVLAALRLELTDLFDTPQGQAYHYPYRTVYRSPDKKFRQSGNTAIWDLYRLEQVLDAVAAGRTVYLVEGEQDVHSLEALGAVATTAPQGVDGFGKVNVAALLNAHVRVIADRDAQGARWAQMVADRLTGYASTLNFFAPAAGKDATDHLARGGGLADLVPEAAPTPSGVVQESERRIVRTQASQFTIRPVQWGWTGRMPVGELTIIPGREGVGKSVFLAWMAAQITRGTLPGQFYGEPRAVLYVASEDSWEYTVAARMMAAGADLDLVYRIHVEDPMPGRVILPVDCHKIGLTAMDVGAACLMLDPVVSLVDDKISPNQSFELRRALEPLRGMAEMTGLMVAALVHFNKAEGADVLSMVPGARAWGEVARAAIALARDDEAGCCVVSQVKNNLGRLDLPNLTYEIESLILDTDAGPADVGRLVWTGECETSASDLLERRGRGAGRPVADTTNEVVIFIQDEDRIMPVKEIAEQFPDIKRNTLRQILKRAAKRGELNDSVYGHYGPPREDESDKSDMTESKSDTKDPQE